MNDTRPNPILPIDPDSISRQIDIVRRIMKVPQPVCAQVIVDKMAFSAPGRDPEIEMEHHSRRELCDTMARWMFENLPKETFITSLDSKALGPGVFEIRLTAAIMPWAAYAEINRLIAQMLAERVKMAEEIRSLRMRPSPAPDGAPAAAMTIEEARGKVGAVWAMPENRKKEFDVDLAEPMARLLVENSAPPAGKPN